MIEGKSAKVPIRVARALVKPHKNIIPLHIINTNLTPIKLYKGSMLAHAECIDEASINVVSQKAEERILQLSATDYASHTSFDYMEDMIPKNISEDHREKLLALLQLYSDIIACDDHDLGRTGILKHSIDTGNAIPICQQVRRMPLQAKEKVRQLLKDMMEKKVISPSKSPWAIHLSSSPLYWCRRKMDQQNFVLTTGKLMRSPERMLIRSPGLMKPWTHWQVLHFLTLDLRSGYWQVEVDPRDQEKMTFLYSRGTL